MTVPKIRIEAGIEYNLSLLFAVCRKQIALLCEPWFAGLLGQEAEEFSSCFVSPV